MESWAIDVLIKLEKFDGLSNAEALPEGSEERGLAEFRDSVAQHLDHTASFKQIVERLEVGAGHPFDVGPRRKRVRPVRLRWVRLTDRADDAEVVPPLKTAKKTSGD